MKKFKNISNITNNSFNFFNPSNPPELINITKNKGMHHKIKENKPLFFHRNKFSNSLKTQKLPFNINNRAGKNLKILENIDSNDITIQNNNNNSIYKTSFSTNNTNTNYYSKRRSQLCRNIQTIESETTQSRNINKYNGHSLSRTTWSSFSFTEGNNNLNILNNGFDYENNNKNQINNKNIFKNDNNNINKNINKTNNESYSPKFNEYNLKNLKEYGIKYCINEDGNPMNIFDIKLKNKNPLAFIIQSQNKNLLVDLDNKIINPNHNGDYILPQKPYFIIRKYDVQFPEIRINSYKNSNCNSNNYISINVNDSNENLNKNKKIILNNDIRRKKNQSCNIYKFINGDESNKFYNKVDKKYIQNKNNILNGNSQIKLNSFIKLKTSLREKKRKYIFINKLENTNKSVQLQIKTDNNDNGNNSYNSISTLTNILYSNNTCKNKVINNNNYLNFNLNKNEKTSILDKNKNNYKQFLNNINKLKNKTNALKDIKCFTHKDIKNLEFKFERKYKNNIIDNSTQPVFLSNFKFNTIEETPKESKKLIEENNTINTINTINTEKNTINTEKNNKNNLENEMNTTLKKNFILKKINNLDLKRYKKKRCSYSLNQYMYDNIEKRNIFSTPHNALNALNTINNSFVSPTPETTSYTTIQNLHHEMETNKKNPQPQVKKINEKKIFNSYKYYLKPKINSQKFFHKRIKTEDMNKGEKKYRFFKFMKGNDNTNSDNTSNFIRSFYITQNDFTVKNCQHKLSNSVEKAVNCNINSNNNVCKCPYCNHLFYN